jgi:hypothetical protein
MTPSDPQMIPNDPKGPKIIKKNTKIIQNYQKMIPELPKIIKKFFAYAFRCPPIRFNRYGRPFGRQKGPKKDPETLKNKSL